MKKYVVAMSVLMLMVHLVTAGSFYDDNKPPFPDQPINDDPRQGHYWGEPCTVKGYKGHWIAMPNDRDDMLCVCNGKFWNCPME